MDTLRILFLDFDGVLNSHDWIRRREPLPEGIKGSELRREEWARRNLDPAAIARVSKIVDATGARVVVSSAWRGMFPLPLLNQFLRLYGGFRHMLIGTTPDGWDQVDERSGLVLTKIEDGIPFLGTRGAEISVWLSMLPRSLPRSWVVLDDEPVSGHADRQILTEYIEGLVDEQVDRAIAILEREPELGA